MTGRGRPRRAKSPGAKCVKGKIRPEETKQVCPPRCPRKEGKQIGAAKEHKPKVQKKTPVQRICEDETARQLTEEMKKLQSALADDTKAPRQGAKAKSVKYAEATKTQPAAPKDTTKGSPKNARAKKQGGKAKCPEQTFTEAKVQPEDLRKATQYRRVDKVDSVLNTTLKKLTIKRDERSDAAEVINKIIKSIIAHLKGKTQCFKDVEEPLRTGSYYENLKISNPDEFDVMLPMPVDRVNIHPFGDDGAFYSVRLKRGLNPLQKFQGPDSLSASDMLKEFRDEVKKCVKPFTEWEVTRKKKGCPAVTLITTVQSVAISLDVVLSIIVKSSWPPFTTGGMKIDGWLGTKVKQQYRRMPYYLVPKYEGNGAAEIDGVLAKDVWRVSFSHVEKAILKNHGSEKTCCEKAGARCCRKDCLKLLKHLLSLLKETDSSFNKFCSYHAKTTLLHACCSRTKDSDWWASDLTRCFQLLLQDFVTHLEEGVLHNFFIPTQNLLSGPGQRKCKSLARRIKEESDNGFPIFK